MSSQPRSPEEIASDLSVKLGLLLADNDGVGSQPPIASNVPDTVPSSLSLVSASSLSVTGKEMTPEPMEVPRKSRPTKRKNPSCDSMSSDSDSETDGDFHPGSHRWPTPLADTPPGAPPNSDNPAPPTGMIAGPVLLKALPHSASQGRYTIPAAFLKHFLKDGQRKPINWTDALQVWASDKWDHLDSPPADTPMSLYSACMHLFPSNAEGVRAYQVAGNNLWAAKMKMWARDPRVMAAENFDPTGPPFPQAVEVPGPSKGMQDMTPLIIELSKATTGLNTLLFTIQKDSDRHSHQVQAVCTENTQVFKSFMSDLKGKVAKVTGASPPKSKPALYFPSRDRSGPAPEVPSINQPAGSPLCPGQRKPIAPPENVEPDD